MSFAMASCRMPMSHCSTAFASFLAATRWAASSFPYCSTRSRRQPTHEPALYLPRSKPQPISSRDAPADHQSRVPRCPQVAASPTRCHTFLSPAADNTVPEFPPRAVPPGGLMLLRDSWIEKREADQANADGSRNMSQMHLARKGVI